MSIVPFHVSLSQRAKYLGRYMKNSSYQSIIYYTLEEQLQSDAVRMAQKFLKGNQCVFAFCKSYLMKSRYTHTDLYMHTGTHIFTHDIGKRWRKKRKCQLTSHWKGFSPVWVLLCSSRPRFWLKALLQSEHLYGFSCSQ